MSTTPPRENLYRAAFPAVELRAADGQADGAPAERVMTGHFAVFNRWTEINSLFEGNFLERIAPGAFRKTFRENLGGMRVLFQHGRDPQIGDKPLGPIRSLAEDGTGAAYEVPLFDTSYNRDLIPGLEAGVYGASFRFNVLREDLNLEPKPSPDNPTGLPERTIREARVSEFGPVTFPAYADATAGLRSITDDMLVDLLRSRLPDLRELLGRNGTGVPLNIPKDGDELCDGCMPDCPCPANQTAGATCTCTCAGCNNMQAADSGPRSATAPGITPVEGAGRLATPEARRELPSVRPLVVIRNPRRSRKVIEL